MFVCVKEHEKGFTIIEMMIAMLIALFILAGMTSLFVSQTRTTHMLNQKSEAMSDLFLASQLMQVALRDAQAVCWDAGANILGYQPIDSTANIDALCNNIGQPENGFFRFDAATAANPASVCWDRPNDGTNCQELIRNLVDGAGLTVVDTGNLKDVKKITISSEYLGKDLSTDILGLSFKVWPRN